MMFVGKIDWESLLRESILIQGFITVICVSTCCVLWLKGIPLPKPLEYVMVTLLGFFFGSKIAYYAKKRG